MNLNDPVSTTDPSYYMTPNKKQKTVKLVELDDVLGLPPTTYTSEAEMMNSIPTLEITPCKPDPAFGLNLFNLISDMPSYKTLLEEHGYTTNANVLKLAFIADNFPTESFTNQYGDSFLSKFTDVVSSGFAEANQIFGSRSASGTIIKAGSQASENFKYFTDAMINTMPIDKEGNRTSTVLGLMGQGLQAGGKYVNDSVNILQGYANKFLQHNPRLQKIINSTDIMLGGGRVDFPQIWKGSSYSSTHSITIRLFNPNPGDLETTKKYIIGPFAAIALLALPISESEYTYNYPFFHKIICKGLFELDPAFITNISIIKGGDQQQIAFNQRMGIVDIRMEIGSLYTTMLAGKNNTLGRPTLKNFIKNMEQGRTLYINKHELDVGEVIKPAPVNQLAPVSNKPSTISPSTTSVAPSRVNSGKQNIYNSITAPSF